MSIPSARRILAAAAAALLLAGCTGADGDDKSGAADSSITVFNGANGAIVENWNPFSPTQLQPTNGTMYEALFWYNLATDAPPQPMLATGYSWNADGTELTIPAKVIAVEQLDLLKSFAVRAARERRAADSRTQFTA